jgi:hypothetical protein
MTRQVFGPRWLLVIVGLCGSAGAPARAQTVVDIPPGSSVGPPQATAGTGLGGSFYFAGHPSAPFATNANIVPNIAAANTFIAGNTPNAQFQATLFNYTGTDTSLPASFLGTDGASLSPPYTTQMYSSIYRMQGFINITSDLSIPGQTGIAAQFFTNSDDGSRLLIAGQTVVDNDGQHGTQTRMGIASFTAAGVYPIEIIYFNDEYNNDTGGASLLVQSTIGTNDPTNPLTLPFQSVYPTNPVPEPATLALTGLGLLSLAAVRRSRFAMT